MKSVVWMCFDADSVVEPVFQNEQRAQAKELTTTIVPSVGPKSKIPVRSNWSKFEFLAYFQVLIQIKRPKRPILHSKASKNSIKQSRSSKISFRDTSEVQEYETESAIYQVRFKNWPIWSK